MNYQYLRDKREWSSEEIVSLLASEGDTMQQLFDIASEVKFHYAGNKVYLRGLIEYSNICAKDCFYCGIRKSNQEVRRYVLSEEEVLNAARFAYEQNYASIVIQAGELESPSFTRKISQLVRKIKDFSNGELGITLSLGEQKKETFREWFELGAHRYLLRIESTNPILFSAIHPDTSLHRFDRRLQALSDLKEIGYQTGTGVMIGLPGQKIEDLASDIQFFLDFDIDMIGMGPYLEHEHTPMFAQRNELISMADRFELTLKMIAVCRIVLKDINIASATALQAIHPEGREHGIAAGANVIMPNITPDRAKANYYLYENKPMFKEGVQKHLIELNRRLVASGNEIAYGTWGDSLHFAQRLNSKRANND